MKRLNPASRAIVLATGLVLAAATLSMAEEAAAPEEKPFTPTIYAGASIGLAEQNNSELGWGVQVLGRYFQYAGIQLEYFNMGNQPNSRGNYDGVYFGVAPLLPVGHGVDLYGQVGIGVADEGEDVVAGAGILYELPIKFFELNSVDCMLRLDYKYLNLDDGDHLLTFGFLFGLHS